VGQDADDLSLIGLRLLFLEDEALVHMNHVEMLERIGCQVTGCMDVAEALDAVECQDFDAALLDVNVKGIMSYGLAESLLKRGIPFAFVTGYESLDEKWQDFPTCNKPCTEDDLRAVLRTLSYK
jgi:CheY-like chemotaxis protein